MFKNILPSSKRISTSEFTMITNLDSESAQEKENQPTSRQQRSNHSKSASVAPKGPSQAYLLKKQNEEVHSKPIEGYRTSQAFDQLLDDLQIPSTLRPKLANMDATVKAAMLKSSQNIKSMGPPPSPPRTPSSSVRRTRSIESMGSPRSNDDLLPPKPPFANERNNPYNGGGSRRSSSHSRGASFDFQRVFSRSQVNLSTAEIEAPKPGKEKMTLPAKPMSPSQYVSVLSGTSSLTLDIDKVKRLRIMLRNEAASWTEDFLRQGGYNALLTRLNEILEVEWREEQHDDQVLHELLRCLKALSTSSIGCCALRSSCPTPFAQLVTLLYSDKKPGDVATRQLIADLLLILFDLYPDSALPASLGRPQRDVWDEIDSSRSNLITLPAPHKNIFSLIRALLLTPAPPPSEAPATPVSPHEFIESLHRPRIYKTYLQELSDVCRDYFWVFCHPNNAMWVLNEVDEAKVEKPRAPGGMTGGVEFEAMAYFTTHLRLVNAIARAAARLGLPAEHELSAYQLHSDLFLSGFERILLITRKASATYYPTLHLEIARYLDHAARAGYELPWTISRLVGQAPVSVLKDGVRARPPRESTSSRKDRTQTAPALPPIKSPNWDNV